MRLQIPKLPCFMPRANVGDVVLKEAHSTEDYTTFDSRDDAV